jgi:hypothetical protein
LGKLFWAKIQTCGIFGPVHSLATLPIQMGRFETQWPTAEKSLAVLADL